MDFRWHHEYWWGGRGLFCLLLSPSATVSLEPALLLFQPYRELAPAAKPPEKYSLSFIGPVFGSLPWVGSAQSQLC